MNIPDLLNGLFELGGSIFLWMTVWKMYRDKMLRGYYWPASVWFATWGYWNLFYYPHLDQWFSFAGGCSIVSANTVWIWQIWHYRKN